MYTILNILFKLIEYNRFKKEINITKYGLF